MRFERRIAEARIRKDWTQERLATETGLSLRTISRLEEGWHRSNGNVPSLRVMVKVADRLKLNVDDMLDDLALDD